LKRTAQGLSTPHPIRFVFPTSRAVYPLALTGSGAKGPLALEFFVFADRQAMLPGFTVEVADRVEFHEGLAHLPHCRLLLGHQGLLRGIRHDCCFTRLSGTLEPAEINRDLELRWQESSPARMTYYTRAYALNHATGTTLRFWSLALSIGGISCWLLVRIADKLKPDPVHGVLLSLVLIGAAATWVVTYLQDTPRIQRDPARVFRSEYTDLSGHDLVMQTAADLRTHLLDQLPPWRELTTVELKIRVETVIQEHNLLNPVTEEPLRHEDSPGNYRILPRGGKDRLLLYGRFGRAWPVTQPSR